MMNFLVVSTVVGNFNHGSWQSGDKLLDKSEALKIFLENRPQAYYESLAEQISFDRELGLLDIDSVLPSINDFLLSKSIKSRCAFVTVMY